MKSLRLFSDVNLYTELCFFQDGSLTIACNGCEKNELVKFCEDYGFEYRTEPIKDNECPGFQFMVTVFLRDKLKKDG